MKFYNFVMDRKWSFPFVLDRCEEGVSYYAIVGWFWCNQTIKTLFKWWLYYVNLFNFVATRNNGKVGVATKIVAILAVIRMEPQQIISVDKIVPATPPPPPIAIDNKMV